MQVNGSTEVEIKVISKKTEPRSLGDGKGTLYFLSGKAKGGSTKGVSGLGKQKDNFFTKVESHISSPGTGGQPILKREEGNPHKKKSRALSGKVDQNRAE